MEPEIVPFEKYRLSPEPTVLEPILEKVHLFDFQSMKTRNYILEYVGTMNFVDTNFGKLNYNQRYNKL